MTKREFDKLTKQNLQLGKDNSRATHSFELRHHYLTRRQKPSAGTTALGANEFWKPEKRDRRLERKPGQFGADAALGKIGAGRGNSKLRDLVFKFEHGYDRPLPVRSQSRARRKY